jgi:hypothetical protein
MKTTSALAMITAGMTAAATMSGCVPFGGCGAPDDPTNVSAFIATAKGTATSPVNVDGIASTSTGVWILSHDGGGAAQLNEYDHVGGAAIHEYVVPLKWAADSVQTGLAAEGDVLWYSDHSATGGDHAFRIDLVGHDGGRSFALQGQTYDLAWDGTSLITVQGQAAIESVDATSGKLLSSVPVRRLSAVSAVAYHDGETWVAQPGQPVLVYDAGGELLATASVDAVATALPTSLHMTFIGDELVVASGTQVTTYAIDRTQPLPGV